MKQEQGIMSLKFTYAGKQTTSPALQSFLTEETVQIVVNRMLLCFRYCVLTLLSNAVNQVDNVIYILSAVAFGAASMISIMVAFILFKYREHQKVWLCAKTSIFAGEGTNLRSGTMEAPTSRS